ncbi:hypothetical protein [Mycobacterium sp. SMC-4]|uniref:hypothetical protein n=1 Tax=Mycobacterium sp. SMC-4 TaxID=2857059 RepID=UPI003D044464
MTAEEVEVIAQKGKPASQTPDAADQSPGEETPQNVAEIPVRSVSVFEHPDHLNKALESARKRLLIISPWVKGGVVNTDFVAKLERRIRAGVEVHIGHGIGNDDRDSDERAIRKLHTSPRATRTNSDSCG